MRESYVRALAEIAKKDKRIFGLVGDIGTFTYDDFKVACPDRFVNVGIAECNMVGMAAGLALEGKIPFIYTITPFVTARAFEPIRVDVCYQNLNVKVVGCGSGFSYSTLGCTHHATDDISIMRALPNMTILSPADPREAGKSVKAAVEHFGPTYIRIGRSGEPNITPEDYNFEIGKSVQLRTGKDLTIIGTGSILYNALQAAEILQRERGLETEVVNMHTIKPIDEKAILESANRTGRVFTLEEHGIIGGLGSAVAEVLAENKEGSGTYFKRIGLHGFCEEYSTDHLDLEKWSQIAIPCVVNSILESYGERTGLRQECGSCQKCKRKYP